MQLRILFISIFLANTLLSFSQISVKGKVIDSYNGTSLSKTKIIHVETKESFISEIDGLFEVFKAGKYLFQHKGYVDRIIELKNNQFFIVQLELNSLELDEVIINTNLIPKKLKKAAASISIISVEDIQSSSSTGFSSILNRTPGVFMQNAALNTNRITIRGIGSRNLYGTSKIRAYFKDIPLTNGSGETTIEDFELASISSLEIIKGAGSSIYGAGLGGAIHISPQNGYFNQTSVNGEYNFGSFGLRKSSINLNYGTTKNSFRAVYSDTHSDGYRENNQYDRKTFTLNSNHFLSDKDEIIFLASFVNLKGFIPSSVNQTSYVNDPKAAAFTWKQAQGFEDADRGIFGLTWNHNYQNNLKQFTSIFTSFRNAYEPRPFNILKENSFAYGIRSRFLGNTTLFTKTFTWSLGGELYKDIYKYQTLENLYKNFPPETGSVAGNQLSNFKENRNYYNLFLDTNYNLTTKTTLSFGLNLNETWYVLEDKFPVSTTNSDQSGSFTFKNVISPKFGLSHLFSDNISVFTSISHGFSPITLNETLLPDGQINTNLKPETGWNFEIGSRGEFIKNKLQYTVSIYRLNIKNLLVSRRTAEDEYIGMNAGKTQHDGLELEMNYNWYQNENVRVSSFLNYTLNNFIFKEFIDDTNDFSGNDLTGVPSDVFNAGIDFNSNLGLYGNINYQFVGSMPITDSNTLFSDSYSLTNFKIGYKTNIIKKLKMNVFFGLNNIFDKAYASQILINATGFGGSAPRYYYPGNPINYDAGIAINYIF